MVVAAPSSLYLLGATITVYVLLGLSISALSVFGLYRMVIKESNALKREKGLDGSIAEA
jgi:hypothetical protein